MSDDEILEIARQAGAVSTSYGNAIWEFRVYDLRRFARLVAQREREACARVCGELADNPQNSEQYRMGANWARERIRARGEQE